MKFNLLLALLFISAFARAKSGNKKEPQLLIIPKSAKVEEVSPNEESNFAEAKFCLTKIYNEYINYKKKNNYYPSESKRMKSIHKKVCEDFRVSARVKRNFFKVTAQRGGMAWSIDETKTIVGFDRYGNKY